MSSDPTFSTLDLRSHAQDYKRDATHKHKWALGARYPVSETSTKIQPARPARKNPRPWRNTSSGTAPVTGAVSVASSPRLNRKHDGLDAEESYSSSYSSSVGSGSSGDSNGSGVEDEGPAVAGVMYSFDRPVGPSHGSQILTLALSKAVERFEERETTKLVHSEYDVLDSEGESVPVAGAAAGKKGRRAKQKVAAASSSSVAAVMDEEDDYEFV